jgi:hypothetical protein
MTEIDFEQLLKMLYSGWYDSPQELYPEMQIVFLICMTLVKIPKNQWLDAIPTILKEIERIKQENNIQELDTLKLIAAGICFAGAFYIEYVKLLKMGSFLEENDDEVYDNEDNNDKKKIIH